MILETTKNNFINGLQFVGGVSGKNQNLPILNNILIEAKKTSISLITTNLELGITSFVRGKVIEEGSLTVPSKTLIDFINTLPDGNLSIARKGNDLVIVCGRQKGKIRGTSSEDFPLIPKIEETKPSVISFKGLIDGLQGVISTTSLNETRPEISGCLFKFSGSELTLVGTDSFRLAEKRVKFIKNFHTGQNIIVPLKTVTELIKIINLNTKLELENGDMEIFLSENQIFFKLKNTELISRLVEGSYPDYKQIIPQHNNHEAIINTKDFIQGVKSVSIFSEQGIFDVEIIGKDAKLAMYAGGSQSGEGEATIDAKITGGEFRLRLNSRYLLDCLHAMNTPDVIFGVTSTDTPCIFKPQTNTRDKETFLYVIMPIKQ